MIILGIIGGLVIVAIVLFYIRSSTQSYGPANNPEGVLSNYVLALNLGEYKRAYDYLCESESKPDFVRFEQGCSRRHSQIVQRSVKILSVEISGDRATVDLSITFEKTDLFEDIRSYRQTATLVLQDGVWKLAQMPYPFWY